MKTLIRCASGLLLSTLAAVVHAQTTDEVTGLVKQTGEAFEQDAPLTIAKINRGEHPFKDADDPSLYVFVLDTDLNVVAHPVRTHTVGTNLRGKPDVNGKLFRDEILATALEDGSGWVDYHFKNPKTGEVTHKVSYFELVTGSDGRDYIVGSGKYFED
jgi:polar amino acid transport system substrate-binding protein